MTPEPYPTPWRWVDLGLPSGTLWLDRNVGADTPEQVGLYFQWGQKFGHRAGDGFSFDAEEYTQQGLNNIRTDLTSENDGASIYFGERYRMPSLEQIQELIQYTTTVDRGSYVDIVSNVNGNSIKMPKGGDISETEVENLNTVRLDCRTYKNATQRDYYYRNVSGVASIAVLNRIKGIQIRPVYNR